uniref:TatD family deoxyribonuclease n=1 Tax=candidate division WOR-3 bacterium TaxID=2052148 RepID=A0A7C4Y5A6_UNCW3
MINIRFYGELKKYNNNIPFASLKKEKKIMISDIMNIFKRPLKECHLILLNGDSVYPAIELNDNDFVSFFPKFKNIDISPIQILNLSGLIDTHSHLDEFENISETLKIAKEFGVDKIVGVGSDYNSNLKLIDLIKKDFPLKIFIALGIHPNNLNSDIEKGIEIIKENIDKIIGIGECGLDYKYKGFNKDLQKDVFSRQIEIAREYKKPIIVHSRGAWEDCFDMLSSFDVEKANFHWFSGDIDILKRIIDRGFFISATPALKFSKPHKDAIKFAPLERILVETDSPVKYFERPSEPKDVIITIKHLSILKDEPVDKVIEITNKNAKEFFGF